jgi:undecaprenyl-diphosphatase
VIHTFVHRYEIDQTRPTFGAALRDAALRVLAPAVLVFAAITGLGFLITGPLGDLPSENAISRGVQAHRTEMWDAVTMVWSRTGNTEIIIGTCVVVVALVWWRTRQWWYAVVPAIAIAAQASVFVASTTIVGRERPDTAHLDPAPPTSSYPSGHMGAATALYLTFALMAQRLERAWLRRLLTAACLAVPLLVGYGRLYRGMHHFSDIIVGLLNGVVCAVLAWNYLRRDVSRGDRHAVPGVVTGDVAGARSTLTP